jgi:hypothetical protein
MSNVSLAIEWQVMLIDRVHKKIALLTWGLLFAALLQVDARSAQAQTANQQIATEITRLKNTLASLNLPAGDSQLYLQQLNRPAEALQSGQLYLSLYYLQGLEADLMALQYQRANSEVEQQGVEGFEKAWRRLGEQLSEGEKSFAAGRFRQTPAIVRALAEISQSQVQPYYKSGRLFGLNTTIKDGLYYLGKASANLGFAIYCQQLNFPQTLSRAKYHSLERRLQQAERETIQAFQQAKAAAEQQRFIPVNSTLKMAWELNRAGSFNGALFQYLEVCLKLGLIRGAPFDESRLSALQKQSEALRARLSVGKTDHSVALLYWQIAEQALQSQAPDKDTLKRAAVIFEEVLPRYFKYLAEGRR